MTRAAWGAIAALVAFSACGESWQKAATTVRSSAVDEKKEPYFAGPWPDDRRLIDGAVPTKRFPRPGMGSLLDNMLSTGDKVAKGWGLSSPIYVPFSGLIDPATLPASPAAAREEGASVFLVAVDPASPAYLKRHPVDFRFLEAPTLYLPAGNVLAVRPFPGFPLEEATKYALVVTTKVKDPRGASVGAEQALWNVLHGVTKDDYYAPLLPVLDALKVKRGEVAGAFLFTTQAVMPELIALRDYLEAQPTPSLDNARLTSTRTSFYVFEGTYKAPNMQHGEVPFSLQGGQFVFDAAGTPVPSEVEDMRVALCVPKGAPPPGGYPVVLYSHGTGGNYRSLIGDICDELAQVGVAAAGIDQVFHGPRGKGANGCFGQDIELCFFNPVNVVAGRNNTRQAALDNVMLRKMLTGAVIPSTLDPEMREVRFKADKVGFFGHSQGGLSGAVYTSFDTHLAGAVLSGAGGHLTTTVLVRKDPIDVRALAEGPLILNIEGREQLDEYHPALAMVQFLADMADPSSYGRYWVKRPFGAPKHLYITSGLVDPYTSAFTAEVMATTASVPQVLPIGERSAPHELAGLEPIALPAQDNLSSEAGVAVTAVFRQFPGQGHFPVFDDATARSQWISFLDGVVKGTAVIVPAR